MNIRMLVKYWRTILVVAEMNMRQQITDGFILFTTKCTPNETVEKPLVRKMFIKISHNRLKICQNVAKMLCGTPKTRHFLAFLSHFSKIIFEKRLIRQSQRLALPAGGRDETTPFCRNQLEATQTA
jgi:hypothetical protein